MNDIIQKICSDFEHNKKLLHKLSPLQLKIIKDTCYQSLWQKYGQQELAFLILNYLKEVYKYKHPKYPLEIMYTSTIQTGDFLSDLSHRGIAVLPIISSNDLPIF